MPIVLILKEAIDGLGMLDRMLGLRVLPPYFYQSIQLLKLCCGCPPVDPVTEQQYDSGVFSNLVLSSLSHISGYFRQFGKR